MAALMYAFFMACNALDRSEEKEGHNRNSYLWCIWFGFTIRLQGLVSIFYAGYEYFVTGYTIEQPVLALIGVLMFTMSFTVLNKNKIAWFVATAITLNPIYWVLNVIYFTKNKECFK